MQFEARELKSYAEPVKSDDLQIGSTYFAVNFVDIDMLIPEFRPIVFIGRDLEADDRRKVYFQDFDSYAAGVRFNGAPEESKHAIFESGDENEVSHVFQFERGLEVLLSCSVRRQRLRRE